MKYKILIADDEKISIHLLEKYLLIESDNYSILKAFDGNQAVDIAKKYLPDLILLDWNMPLLDGEGVIKELKFEITTHDIPIIVISAVLDEKNFERALELGATDFIRKPIKKVELKARISTALKLSEVREEVKFQRQRIDTHIDELNKLSLIVKKTDNAVLLISPDGDIEWANEAFSRMYGLSFEDFTNRYGNKIKDISFNKKRAINKFEELIKEKKSVSYVSYVRGFNAIGEKWIQTTLTPIFDDYQNIDKIVAIETDISTSKRHERNLEEKNKKMEELTVTLKKTNEELENQKKLIQDEREKTETLLENILPRHVASQLKNIGSAKPRNYKLASIMFTDFEGFTKLCEHLKPEEIVNHLDKFFSVYDDIVMDNYLEKIKTIGDAYMCVGGIPVRNRSNPFNVVLAALEMQNFMNNLDKYDPDNEIPRWKIRLGIHTGPIVAGVVGKIKFAYDVWGDSVNIASRMESAGEEGKVNVSGATYELIKDYFDCEFRGEIKIKNRGEMAMYFVNRLKPKYSKDKNGVKPNKEFTKFLHSL